MYSTLSPGQLCFCFRRLDEAFKWSISKLALALLRNHASSSLSKEALQKTNEASSRPTVGDISLELRFR